MFSAAELDLMEGLLNDEVTRCNNILQTNLDRSWQIEAEGNIALSKDALIELQQMRR